MSQEKNDIQENLERVLDTSLDADSRRKALYLLTQARVPALAALARIAMTELPPEEHLENPHSFGTLSRSFELSLRATSIEALDSLSQDSPQVLRLLEEISRLQPSPTLKFFSSVSLSGISQGRPGRLGRLFEQVLADSVSEVAQ